MVNGDHGDLTVLVQEHVEVESKAQPGSVIVPSQETEESTVWAAG